MLDPAKHARLFWRKVDQRGEDDCWFWQGVVNDQGLEYGVLYRTIDGAKVKLRAHRVAFELTRGPIPEGLRVLHSCDEPRCCNPAHLSLGSDAENHRQRVERGRSGRAGRPRYKRTGVSRQFVVHCYLEGLSILQTAALMGVTPNTVVYHRRLARLEGRLDASS